MVALASKATLEVWFRFTLTREQGFFKGVATMIDLTCVSAGG